MPLQNKREAFVQPAHHPCPPAPRSWIGGA